MCVLFVIISCLLCFFFFFFKQKTAYEMRISDWSSDGALPILAWVNGELVSYLRVDIPDVASMTPAEAEALSRLAQTQLVQIGQGNVFNGADNGGLVIQNTLNGQDLRAHTTLDVSVNTLGLLQALNVGDALPNANRTEEHTPEPQSLMRISYAVFCLKKKKESTY